MPEYENILLVRTVMDNSQAIKGAKELEQYMFNMYKKNQKMSKDYQDFVNTHEIPAYKRVTDTKKNGLLVSRKTEEQNKQGVKTTREWTTAQKGFRMEYLSTLFAGMAVSGMFQGQISRINGLIGTQTMLNGFWNSVMIEPLAKLQEGLNPILEFLEGKEWVGWVSIVAFSIGKAVSAFSTIVLAYYGVKAILSKGIDIPIRTPGMPGLPGLPTPVPTPSPTTTAIKSVAKTVAVVAGENVLPVAAAAYYTYRAGIKAPAAEGGIGGYYNQPQPSVQPVSMNPVTNIGNIVTQVSYSVGQTVRAWEESITNMASSLRSIFNAPNIALMSQGVS